MDEEREMILRMLKEGKVSVEEADALLHALEEESDAERSPSPAPGDLPETPELRAELRGVFNELVESIPKEVMRELKRTKDILRPGFLGALQALWGLGEGQAETSAEEPMAAGERLTVRNVWGDVQIKGSPDGHLRLRALRRVWAATADDAQQLAQALMVAPRRSGADVLVDVPQVEQRRVRVDLELAVPAGVAVSLQLAKGDVQASGLSGPLDVDLMRGDMSLQAVANSISLDVRSGDVDVRAVEGTVTGRVLSGDVRVERAGGVSLDVISGDVAIDEAGGDVSVEGKNGDLMFRGVRARTLRARTLSGDIEAGLAALAPDGAVSLETLSGDVGLILPEGTRGEIDAAVQSGEIDCALPLVNRTGDRRSLRGLVGGPGAAMTLRTTSGDISIRGAR